MNNDLFKNIVILTGAGVSAESGIRTFRDNNGLWEDHRIEDVATPEAFQRNPELVQRFYNLRRAQLKDPAVQPNVAHLALAELEKQWQGDFLLVTQNVDNLHRRAGSQKLLHMHGNLDKVFCYRCGDKMDCTEDIFVDTSCRSCTRQGTVRPDIVWFGEMPYHMDAVEDALQKADYFVSIGTSGHVYPAAGFARMARKAERIEINLTSTQISDAFHKHFVGPASAGVREFVDSFLKGSNA